MGFCLAVLVAFAQFNLARTGELRLTVVGPDGLPLVAQVELVSDASDFHDTRATATDGSLTLRRLPFGPYRLDVRSDGFATVTEHVAVTSEQPIERRIVLPIAGLQSQVTVAAESTLIARDQAAAVQHVGRDTLRRRPAAAPGRSLVDVVQTQPGWLLEANGVLHPRGSEYQTQYVIDGLPTTDNRSPAFAPEIDADAVNSLTVLTGGYPAEYGRKLGAIIEVASESNPQPGFHGDGSVLVGSHRTRAADAMGGRAWARTSVSGAVAFSSTDRYLDPPTEENFTNHGHTEHLSARIDQDLSSGDRIGGIFRSGRTNFQVPNERIQEQAGQRQDGAGREDAAQFSYQHFMTQGVFDSRASLRRVGATLDSNAAATPIQVSQDRGLTEGYYRVSLTGLRGAHEWKVGGDLQHASVREAFGYTVTNPDAFDPGLPGSFTFDDRGIDNEQSLFAQDRMHLGDWTLSTGLRWDRYAFLVNEHAFSPRLAVAWSPSLNLVLRAAYDRTFETPAVENLLLASSPRLEELGDQVVRLPVPPSRGHFLEGGVTTGIGGIVRLGLTAYRRAIRNFADDDVLLNTGVSFPTTFDRATIEGLEFKMDIPRRGRLSGSVSYSLMRGRGRLPITGGLFLDDDAAALLASRDSFAITQDQRHTLQARATYDVSRRVWLAAGAAYGSGLPFEFAGTEDEARSQYGGRIAGRVDFGSGRVRPRCSLDASSGIDLEARPGRLTLQLDVRNLTNRLDVINFAGLFSGTALAEPRSIAVRLRVGF